MTDHDRTMPVRSDPAVLGGVVTNTVVPDSAANTHAATYVLKNLLAKSLIKHV